MSVTKVTDAMRNVTAVDGTKISGAVPLAALGNAPATDLTPVHQAIATFGLHTAVSDNKASYNLPNAFIDQFEDCAGLATLTDVSRHASEYCLTISPSVDSGGTSGSWGAGNTSENVGGGSSMTYGTGDDLGMNNNSYNLSSTDDTSLLLNFKNYGNCSDSTEACVGRNDDCEKKIYVQKIEFSLPGVVEDPAIIDPIIDYSVKFTDSVGSPTYYVTRVGRASVGFPLVNGANVRGHGAILDQWNEIDALSATGAVAAFSATQIFEFGTVVARRVTTKGDPVLEQDYNDSVANTGGTGTAAYTTKYVEAHGSSSYVDSDATSSTYQKYFGFLLYKNLRGVDGTIEFIQRRF